MTMNTLLNYTYKKTNAAVTFTPNLNYSKTNSVYV